MSANTEQRKLAAIMFTDMVGYSALAQRDEKLALQSVAVQEQSLRPLWTKFGGREVKSTGDGFVVEFASALEAVNCAVEVQRALALHNATTAPERRFQIRIGLHLGDVVVRGGDIFGDGVNIAARIEPLAEPGGICVSRPVQDQVANKFELPLVALGAAELKNIQTPMEVYRVALPWETADGGSSRTIRPTGARASSAVGRGVPPSRTSFSRTLPWAVAALCLVALLAVIWRQRDSPGSATQSNATSRGLLRKLEIQLPSPTKPGASAELKLLTISPDGRKLLYQNADGLWWRWLDRVGPSILISSGEKIHAPFWSSQSTDVAWFEENRLMRAPITGGSPVVICTLPPEVPKDSGDPSAWLDDGQIIFATGWTGLYRVSAQGGRAELVHPVGTGEKDFHGARALPNSRGVLFVVHRNEGVDTIAAWDPKKGKNGRSILLQSPGEVLTWFAYSASGHVLVGKLGGGLWAFPFSLEKLERTGEPFRLQDSGGSPSVSLDGTLVLNSQASDFLEPRQLVWVNRSGTTGKTLGSIQKGITSPRFSPDERYVAYSAAEYYQAPQIWIVDVATGTAQPQPQDANGESLPFWLGEGQDLVARGVDGSEQCAKIRTINNPNPKEKFGLGLILSHVSRSGRYAFLASNWGKDNPMSYVRLSGDKRTLIPFPTGLVEQGYGTSAHPSLSSDDSALAYFSITSGKGELYVVAFPGFTNRVQVSRGGGKEPQWRRDGSELFYLSLDGKSMMSVSVTNKNGMQLGEPVKLFDLPGSIYVGNETTINPYDVSADGQRFLMVQRVKDEAAPAPKATVLLIENWFEEFREKK